MNFSPLNDAEFQEYRKEVHRKAAKKRRVRTLIILVSVALLSAAVVALLGLAAWEMTSRINVQLPFGNKTPAPLPPLDDDSSGVIPFSPNQTDNSGLSDTTPTSPDELTAPVTPTIVTPTEPTGVTHKTTIYIDPGHGFRSGLTGKAMDLGAGNESAYTRISAEQGKALYEADLNLAVSLKLKTMLQTAGYDVIMSREDYVQESLSLADRAQRVRMSTADACISIHANFYEGKEEVYGARVYACDSTRRPKDGAACQSFARTVMAAIDAAGASRKAASLQSGNGLVMCNSTTTTPAVLVEMCFLTDETDARNALTEEWQIKMATALYNAITIEFPLEYSFT